MQGTSTSDRQPMGLSTAAGRGFWSREGGLGLLVLFGAFAIRTYGLARQSFWWDEAYTALLAQKGVRAIFQDLAVGEFHPPLHYLMERAWIPLAGQSEFALRFLSVACGVLSVAVAWRLGRRLFGPAGGISAALAFAVGPFHFYYTQEARPYAPLLLFTVLTFYVLHRALAEGRAWIWACYSVVGALGIYTHYYFAFVLVAGAALLAAQWPRSRPQVPRWLLASLGTGVLYAPWLPTFLRRAAGWESLWATLGPPLDSVTWTWNALTLGIAIPAIAREPLPFALALATAAALAVGGIVGLRRANSDGLRFAFVCLLVPLALAMAVAVAIPAFHPRYATPVIPGLYLAAAGVASLRWRGRWVVAGLLLATAAYGLWGLNTNPALARDDYRSAVAYIQEREQPGDTIIYNAYPGFAYYYRGSAPASYFPGTPYDEAHVVSGLNALTAGRTRLWYLHHSAVPNDPAGFLESHLDRQTTKAAEVWWRDLRVTLYDFPDAPAFSVGKVEPTRVNFAGKLLLTGYSLTAPSVSAGGQSELTLDWQVLAPPGADLGIALILTDDRGRAWGRGDVRPRDATFHPSSAWTAGETVTTRHALPALIGTPPGQYHVEVSVYRLADARGLDILDENGRLKGQSERLVDLAVVLPAAPPAGDASLPLQLHARLTPEVELAAAAVEPSRAGPGTTVNVTLLWRATARPAADNRVVLSLVAASGATVAESAGPVADGRRPIGEWGPGELVREQRELVLPADVAAGSDSVLVRLLDPATGAEVGQARIGAVEIDAVSRQFTEPDIPQRVDASLGGKVVLLGYRLTPAEPRPGDRLSLTLYWRALTTFDQSYHVFTHVLDAASRIRGQADGVPRSWSYPTTAWLPGEVVEDVYEIDLARDAPPGEYQLEVGMYDPATGERLPVVDSRGETAGDHLILQTVRIGQ